MEWLNITQSSTVHKHCPVTVSQQRQTILNHITAVGSVTHNSSLENNQTVSLMSTKQYLALQAYSARKTP